MNPKKRSRYRENRRPSRWRGWHGTVGLLTLLFSSNAVAAVSVTEDQAKAIALRTAPGKVIRIEHDRDVIEVVIRDRAGRTTGVEVDRKSGRVVDVLGCEA